MNIVPLESALLSLQSGARPKGGVSEDSGEIPSLGGEHVNSEGGFDFTNIKRISRSFYESMRAGRIAPFDILVVKDGATTGKTSFVRDDFPFPEAAVNEHVFCVRVDQAKASPAYVYHFLRSPPGQKAIQLDFRGATVGGISREFAAKAKLPLPRLAEQRRIAEVLDRAEALRAKRRVALAQIDSLTQSLFLELFGDPGTNTQGLCVEALGEHLLFVTSGGRGWAKFYAPTGSRFIRSLDVQMRAERMVQGVATISKNAPVQLSAALVSGDGTVRAGSQVSGPFKGLLDLEKRLVFDVAAGLGIQLTEAERQRILATGPKNLTAFLAYSDGLTALDRGDYQAASRAFSASVRADPSFGAAQQGLQTSQTAPSISGTGAGELTTVVQTAEQNSEPPTDPVGGAISSAGQDVAPTLTDQLTQNTGGNTTDRQPTVDDRGIGSITQASGIIRIIFRRPP